MMLKICQSFLCYITQQMCSQTFVNQQQYSSSVVLQLLRSSRKNRYPPHGRSLEIPRWKGVLKAKILQAKYEAKLDPCKNGTGILAGSCQDPGKIPAGIPPRFWPPGFPVPAGILTGILGGRRDSRRPKSRRDPGGNLAGILGGRRDSRRPKSRRDPGGSLAGILGG